MNSPLLRPILIAAIFGLPQLASAQVQLISWWNFDTGGATGPAIDAAAGLPAQLRGGPARTAAGAGRTGAGADRAMSFGTGGEHLYVADASFLNEAGTANAISISFWQNLNAVRGQTTLFAAATSVLRATSFHTPWGDSKLYFDTAGCCDGNMRIEGMPTDPVNWVGEWHHLVMIKNGDTKEIYVDGVLGPAGTNTNPLPTDYTELFIGNSENLVEAVDGKLDDVAIFAGALDANQITQLKNGASPSSIAPPADTDTDGLPDAYENRFFPGDLTKLTATGDFDADGRSNPAEFASGTDPTLADSDADGLADGVETNTGTWVSASNTGTNPLSDDSDGDGLSDGAENNSGTFISVAKTGTNPNKADTDGDTWSDPIEISAGSNPSLASSVPALGALDLLAWWPFNNSSQPTTATDVISSIEATLENGAAYSAEAGGRTGAAGDLALDLGMSAGSQTAQVLDATWLNTAALGDQLAISFWQNLYQMSASSAFWITSPSSTGTQRGFQAHTTWSDGRIYFDTAGCCGSTQRIAGGLAGIDLVGSWHHFVIQKNGPAKEVWVDGVLTVSGTNVNPLPSDLTTLYIGSGVGALGTQGLIDDFAIFGNALVESQIVRLAAGESPAALLGPTAPLAFTKAAYNAATHTIQLTWNSQAGAVYVLDGSKTMATGSWLELNDNIPSGGASTTYTYDVNTFPPPGTTPPVLFLRVKKQ